MIIVIILLIFLVLALFILAPSLGKKRAEEWRGVPFAHRGLHDALNVENSLEAFERACQHGFGIELDVQLSRDGHVVVFHDDTLLRMTGDSRRVDQVDLAELQTLSLLGRSRIPTFAEVLALVNGRVPLLVEIKNGKRNNLLCEKVMAQLRAYRGRYIIESFNPLILRWLRKNAPEVIRGQLVGPKVTYIAAQMGVFQSIVLSSLALNFLARPDFVAYDVTAPGFTAPKLQRALFHTPLAAWTVCDEATYRACLARNESPIFEAGAACSDSLPR